MGEPTFDFFAPSFVEMHRREGRWVARSYSDELPVYVPEAGYHEALGRHWGDGGVTVADRELATETLRAYGELQLDSAVMRCKLYSLLLPAET